MRWNGRWLCTMYMPQLRLETSSCYQICSYSLYSTTNIYTHTHTHCFNSYFPHTPGPAISPLILTLQWFLSWASSAWAGQAKTLHILFDAIFLGHPLCIGSFSFHLHASLEPVCIIFTFNMSKLPQSAPLNIDRTNITKYMFLAAKLHGKLRSAFCTEKISDVTSCHIHFQLCVCKKTDPTS